MPDAAIWKTRKPLAEEIVIDLPLGSTLLKVGDQSNTGASLDFWFVVPDPEAETEARVLYVFGTGQPIDSAKLGGSMYWDTVITAGGALVWHVFLVGER